jgi:glycine dehydrogenase subunit 2
MPITKPAYDKLIFELSRADRHAYSLPECDVPVADPAQLLPKHLLRETPAELPEVSEVDVIRHYSRLSQMNYGVDTHFYPLGSCTMKYNPKINEDMARLPGFARLHPMTPEGASQGALQLMYELAQDLAEVSGMDHVSLQPAAGAQGELAGVLMIRAYHLARGERRTKVLIPDSAHGTNPASTALAGLSVVELKSEANGDVDLLDLEQHLGDDVAAFMITQPNTLGLFESKIHQITEMCHAKGVQVYMDGANFNAILGITRPGDLGFDVCHFNLHKTFTTPHGGGGPGAGPVGIKSHLAPFLPTPVVVKKDAGGMRSTAIGRSRSASSRPSGVISACSSAPTRISARWAPTGSAPSPTMRCSTPITS